MNIEALRRERAPLWPIALARIAIGGLWLLSLRWKLPPDFAPDAGRGLLDYLQLEAQYPALAIYGRFVEAVVIPNFTLFAWVIFLTELLVGLSLLTGTLTRLGAAVGLLMALNLGVGMLAVPNEWPWSYVMLAMFHFIFLFAAAGRRPGGGCLAAAVVARLALAGADIEERNHRLHRLHRFILRNLCNLCNLWFLSSKPA